VAKLEESEVLIATALWLHSKRWKVREVRPPPRRKADVEDRLGELGVEVLGGRGPDIVAKRGRIEWRIECKGMPDKSNTLWSDFNRGLGQALSHYDKNDGTVRLGFALPDTVEYRKYCERRIPMALREATNLGLLFWDPVARKMDPVSTRA